MSAFAASLRDTWDAAWNLLYPPLCQICAEDRASAASGYVCDRCSGKVRFLVKPYCDRCGAPYDGKISHTFVCSNCHDLNFHFRFARSSVVSNAVTLAAIHRYKYNRALYFESFLADLLVRQAAPALKMEPWHLIVPVPLHAAKEREREFNQAERLARHLSQSTGIPVDSTLLNRIKPTATQTKLNRTERAANMQDAFAPQPGRRLKGEKVILIDDVFTTGATTNACAKVLRQMGSGDLCVWTLARGA